MKLLLTSNGLTNKSIITALGELVEGKLDTKNLAYIPTAANVASSDKRWLIKDLVMSDEAGFKKIDIVDISALKKDIWFPRLQEADILQFAGGNASYLLYWIKKSGLEKILPSLLKERVYVGVSAGSIVATHSLALSNNAKKEYAKEIGAYTGEEGLGYVKIHVRPHFNSPHFPHAGLEKIQKIAEEINEPIYAIDDNTAIKVVDGELSIVSEGKWEKFN